MPTSTYDLLSFTTLDTNTTTITISSISGSYRDLILVLDFTGGNGDVYPKVVFNQSTGFPYKYAELRGVGGGGAPQDYSSTAENNLNIYGPNATTTESCGFIVEIPEYASSKTKVVLTRGARGDQSVNLTRSLWDNTATITRIDISSTNGNTIATGSTVALYGVVA